MARTRVLHVIPTLDASGAEKQLALLATGLAADRYETIVCALTRGGPYAETLRRAGIEVHVLNKRWKADPFTLHKLYRLMAERKPDVVHSWLFAGNSYARIAARLAKPPVVIASERCVDIWKTPASLRLDRWLARGTDRVVANSQAVADFYAKVGVPTEKLRVIPNAVEPAPAVDVDVVRAALGVPADRRLIGFVGRLWPQKRVDQLIWATDILRIGGYPVTTVIVGDGPRRSSLERFAHKLELDGVVRFLGHRADAPAIIASLDALALPSQFEGMPNVALEAMAAGVPVVATRIAGIEEVVVDGETGLLTPTGDPFELARGLSRLVTDEPLRRRLGAAGQRRAESMFAVPRMIAAYETLYREALQGCAHS